MIGRGKTNSKQHQTMEADAHLLVHSPTQISKAVELLGHIPMQAEKDPPGHSVGVGEGVGVGVGDGVGVGVGVGFGVGCGELQRLGSGPLSTRPVIFRLLTLDTDELRSPQLPQSPGTQPCHCEE